MVIQSFPFIFPLHILPIPLSSVFFLFLSAFVSPSLSPPLSLAQAHRLARYGVVTFLTAGLTFVLACPTHAPAFRQL